MRRVKLILLAATAMAMSITATATPVLALDIDFGNDDFVFHRLDFGNVGQDFDQEAESGDIDLEADISNTGDNSNVCAPVSQFANTGNVQNEQGFTSFGDGFFGFDDLDGDFFDFDGFDNGDVDFEGSSVTFEPSLDTTCDQSVQQSSAASSN